MQNKAFSRAYEAVFFLLFQLPMLHLSTMHDDVPDTLCVVKGDNGPLPRIILYTQATWVRYRITGHGQRGKLLLITSIVADLYNFDADPHHLLQKCSNCFRSGSLCIGSASHLFQSIVHITVDHLGKAKKSINCKQKKL